MVVASTAPGVAFAQDPSIVPPRVPNEVLVKLRDDFPDCAHCLLAQGHGLTGATGRRTLDQLRLKHGITMMEPLFGGVHAAARRTAAKQKHVDGTTSGIGAEVENRINQIYRVRVGVGSDPEKVAADLLRDPVVEWAEPNYLYQIDRGFMDPEAIPEANADARVGRPDTGGAVALPNDPFLHSSGSWGQDFADLWGLFQIDAPTAWEHSQGEGVVVAVIDTGLDIDHPDIATNVWTNETEIAGNGVDDDENGFVDDVYGWDFTTCARRTGAGSCLEEKPRGSDLTDSNGHGSHIAGIVAAAGDNGIGIVGVAPRAQVMAVKGFDHSGRGNTVDLAEALVYAAENGADVINASWTGPPTETLGTALTYVTEVFDVVVIGAAGNDGAPLERGYFPANHPGVLAVGATTELEERAPSSNFGGSLDLTAPGGGGSGSEEILFPRRSILSLLSNDARESDGFAAECDLRCICEDGSPQLPNGDCIQNRCAEWVEGCDDGICCLRCDDGTVFPEPRSQDQCPFSNNSCETWFEECTPGPWLVGDGYVRASGTSMAAPHVAGVAALVRSRRHHFTWRQVNQVLRNTADDVDTPGWDLNFGYGRVNAHRAVEVEEIPIAEIVNLQNRGKVWERDLPFQVHGIVAGPGDRLANWRLLLGDDGAGPAVEVASGLDPVSGPLVELRVGGNMDLVAGHRYTLRLEVTDIDGSTAVQSKSFFIPNPQYVPVPIPDRFDQGGRDPNVSSGGTRFAFKRIERGQTGESRVVVFDSFERSMIEISRASSPVLSANGRFLLYLFEEIPPYWGFYLLDIDSGSRWSVPLQGVIESIPPTSRISADGTRVAFISRENLDPAIGNEDRSIEVFLFDLPVGPSRQVTSVPRNELGGLEITDMEMSSDGLRVVFNATDTVEFGASVRQAVLYDDNTGETHLVGERSDAGLALSADGRTLAYHDNGTVVVDVASGHKERVLDPTETFSAEILSDDGARLAFLTKLDLDSHVMNEDLSTEIFVLDLNTRRVLQVSDTINSPEGPIFLRMSSDASTFLVSGPSEINGLGLELPLARFVLKRANNRPPQLDAPSTILAREGRRSVTVVTASDPDDDAITFFAQRVVSAGPIRLSGLANSEFRHNDLNRPVAELVFTPRFNESGTYHLRLAAFDDGGGVAVKDVTLVIEDAQAEGDANCDEQLDATDLDALIHAVFDPFLQADCATSDANGDGRVSAADVVALQVILPLVSVVR